MEVRVSIRHSLLALLSNGPMHGYGLKTEFEAATADVWPLNVGQVYTTLLRLERDGLVTAEDGAEGQKVYEITDAGRGELGRWFETPVPRAVIPRQELAIKLVFAMRSGMAEVAAVVQRQRMATVRALQDLTRLKADAEASGDTAWLLILDGLVFQAEAEARWLDLCEARLARQTTAATPAPTGPVVTSSVVTSTVVTSTAAASTAFTSTAASKAGGQQEIPAEHGAERST
jgi:DNA-binding PadR family transcriptional regulator